MQVARFLVILDTIWLDHSPGLVCQLLVGVEIGLRAKVFFLNVNFIEKNQIRQQF